MYSSGVNETKKNKESYNGPVIMKRFFCGFPKVRGILNNFYWSIFLIFFCIGHLNGSEYSYRGSHNKTMRLKINTFPVYVYTVNSKEL